MEKLYRIKPLEWVEEKKHAAFGTGEKQGEKFLARAGGRKGTKEGIYYWVEYSAVSGKYHWIRSYGTWTKCASIEEGKRLAEEDYENRLKEMLEEVEQNEL